MRSRFPARVRCGLAGTAPSVLGCFLRIFLPPRARQVTIENVLDVAWIEDMEGDGLGSPAHLHGTGAYAFQATILEPFVTLAGGDGENVLCLARKHGQCFDPSSVLEMVAEAAWNASASVCNMRNTMRPVSALANFLTVHGRRARISRSIPFRRKEEPSVADGGSGHSATTEAVLLTLCSDVRSGAAAIAATMPLRIFRKDPRFLLAMFHVRSSGAFVE